MVRIVFMKRELTQNSEICLPEEEVGFSDENSDESPLSSSPEYEIEHKSDSAFASPSASEDDDAAAAFAEEPARRCRMNNTIRKRKKR